ncbi:MAG: limonene-1,2-epoxide hydrolase family protein [Myxococcota bacterium]
MARGDNEKTVLAFMGAVNRNDKNGILAFFREDSVFHNIPMPPAIGPEAIWKIMEMVHGRCSAVNWKLHSIAESSDGSVLTERTDRYRIDGEWIEYPLMGIFELDGRIITAWREYFDLQQHVDQNFDFPLQERSVPIPE